MAQSFTHFVNEEENMALMEEVTKVELQEVLYSFQKNKSPSLDGWTMEFFLGFYELIGKELLQVVEEDWMEVHILSPIHSNFIELILKSNDTLSMNDFIPIPLWNFLYKVVAKVIARRIKCILSDSISKEKFVFLEGRKIHESITVA